ncbi:MAG: hypothetical protein R6V44_08740 [Paracoccaceae bacterium]
MRHAPLALAAALVVAGCTSSGGGGFFGAPITHSVIVDTVYSPLEIRGAGAPFPAEVRGAPPGGATEAEALESVRMPLFLGGPPLVPADPEERGPRVVIAFGGAPLNGFCERGAGGVDLAPGAALTAAVGICRDERLVTRGVLEAPGIGGPDDPAYADTLNDALRAVMPAHNPNIDRDRRDRFVPGF